MPGDSRRAGAVALAGLAGALGGLLAGCGGSTASPVTIPPTVATTLPSGPTVPAFGSPAGVLPATAANATANASGACSRFTTLYIQLAQSPVAAPAAAAPLAQAASFAAAAALAAPTQWGQLRHDVDALAAATATPAWSASADQEALAPVQAVKADCRPLQ